MLSLLPMAGDLSNDCESGMLTRSDWAVSPDARADRDNL